MDLQKYFESFPFSAFFAAGDRETLFFIKETEYGKLLHSLNISAGVDLSKAEVILEKDLNTCSFAVIDYDAENKIVYVFADEDHNERYNLWRLDLEHRSFVRLTNSNYAAGLLITDKYRQCYYGVRSILPDRSFETTYCQLDLKKGTSKNLFSDKGWEYRHSWHPPTVLDDPSQLIIPLSLRSIRQKTNLGLVDTASGSMRLLLPEAWENGTIGMMWDHAINGKVYFESEHEHHSNVYSFDSKSGALKAETHFERRNLGLGLIEKSGRKFIVALFPVPEKEISELVVIDLETGNKRTKAFAGSCSLKASKIDIWVVCTEISQPSKHSRINFETLEPEIEFTSCLRPVSELVHSTQKFLTYKTFDGADVPAYLALPSRSPVRAAIVRAFYGGTSEYRIADQILLEQGIAILSPAVRGSWGWGKAWEEKIRGDLGGNEILDVIWGARYLERELKLKPSQIGAEGGSHGGYAVLRALTMPKDFGGVDSHYPWGFGLCWAGFADLVKFHTDSWIADWLTMMLGEYPANNDLYIDRAPLTHFEKLSAPLFVVHGTHDRRVPGSTMTEFLKKLEASDKPHMIHMVEGQGHTAGDKKDKNAQFLAQQQFLERFVL